MRERQPIPTIEEVLQGLNDSTVFSRVDLKWGFHQILLAGESRHVIMFVTHRACLKRYVLRWHLKLESENRLGILPSRLFQRFRAP